MEVIKDETKLDIDQDRKKVVVNRVIVEEFEFDEYVRNVNRLDFNVESTLSVHQEAKETYKTWNDEKIVKLAKTSIEKEKKN